MKKIIFNISILLLILLLLFNPNTTLQGSSNGINLWYKAILPSLLPFMIISNIIIKYDLTDTMSLLMRPITKMLKLDKKSGYCIFAGLFFGYPSCAATAIAMYKKNLIDARTANICILSFNNVSPAFLSGFICVSILKNLSYMPIVFFIHYTTILLNSLLVRYVIYKGPKEQLPVSETINKQINDGPIISGIKNIAKLGVYIMFFSILSAYAIRFTNDASPFICSIFEVTCGAQIISEYVGNHNILLTVLMPILAFGGICGIFQTFCVDTVGITDKKKYIQCRLSAVFICTAISLIFNLIQ